MLRAVDTQTFIQRARIIHGDRYDYSLVDYVNIRTNVIIICPIHGAFRQQPMAHINNGSGCHKCRKPSKVIRVGVNDRSIIREDGKRKCSYCENYFELDKFNKNKGVSDGLNSSCKNCEHIITAKYRDSHREEIRKRDNAKGPHKWAMFKETHKEEIEQKKKKRELINQEKRVLAKIARSIRARIRDSIKRKSNGGRSTGLLGCDILFFRDYIESLFDSNMSWNNYGYYGWHLDHIIPCVMFDMTNDDDVKKCFHYTNYQPLWRRDNQSKGGRRIGK
jgi:hypothetical protein